MRRELIFIDLRNTEHVKWFNEVVSKLIRVVEYTPIVETATNKPVGYVFVFKSLFGKYIVKKNLHFLKNPRKVIIRKK